MVWRGSRMTRCLRIYFQIWRVRDTLPKSKTLRDSGLGKLPHEEEEEEKPSPLISTRTPTNEELEERPRIEYSDYWTSIDKTSEFFAEKGYVLNSVNYDKMTSGELRYGANTAAERFFSRVDISKAPIEVTIPVMRREKGTEEYKVKALTKTRTKEYLVYHLRLESISWEGQRITCTIENEGIGLEPKEQLDVSYNPETGRSSGTYRLVGVKKRHYLPFSKPAVDAIIKKFGVEKDSIRYYGLIPSMDGDYKCPIFTYEQFTSLEWEQFTDIANKWKNKIIIDRKNNPPPLLQKGIA